MSIELMKGGTPLKTFGTVVAALTCPHLEIHFRGDRTIAVKAERKEGIENEYAQNT